MQNEINSNSNMRPAIALPRVIGVFVAATECRRVRDGGRREGVCAQALAEVLLRGSRIGTSQEKETLRLHHQHARKSEGNEFAVCRGGDGVRCLGCCHFSRLSAHSLSVCLFFSLSFCSFALVHHIPHHFFLVVGRFTIVNSPCTPAGPRANKNDKNDKKKRATCVVDWTLAPQACSSRAYVRGALNKKHETWHGRRSTRSRASCPSPLHLQKISRVFPSFLALARRNKTNREPSNTPSQPRGAHKKSPSLLFRSSSLFRPSLRVSESDKQTTTWVRTWPVAAPKVWATRGTKLRGEACARRSMTTDARVT